MTPANVAAVTTRLTNECCFICVSYGNLAEQDRSREMLAVSGFHVAGQILTRSFGQAARPTKVMCKRWLNPNAPANWLADVEKKPTRF
jgi:hypothetical protein